MMHFHLIGLLTFELLTLIAAFFLLVYVKKNEQGNGVLHFAKALVIALHVLVLVTIVHGVIHHLHGHSHDSMHHQSMEQQIHRQGID